MSKPGADASMQDSLIGLWHLEQARTPISAQLNSGSGMDGWHDASLKQAGAQNSLSQVDAEDGR
jgi:hypothetical protein